MRLSCLVNDFGGKGLRLNEAVPVKQPVCARHTVNGSVTIAVGIDVRQGSLNSVGGCPVNAIAAVIIRLSVRQVWPLEVL